MTAFVLGNGESRKDLDPNYLMTKGSVYGCNALYRTFAPTALIATDRPIAEEIQKSGYSSRHRFYTRRPIEGLGALQLPKKYFGYSSGPNAINIAAEDRHRDIYLLGFDMGPGSDGRFNNVYASTEHYKKIGSQPTYTGNWIKQICTVVRDHADQTFVRVHGPTTNGIAEFESLPNMKKLTLAEFVALINTPKDL